ncbi:MAG: hypothetical protein KDJ90_00525 [Nitratireductor sp.]|nr:hypothetical protein [Nitratireductor sp.]
MAWNRDFHVGGMIDELMALRVIAAAIRKTRRYGPGKRTFVTSQCFRDRSKYSPHQGKRERARRLKRLALNPPAKVREGA